MNITKTSQERNNKDVTGTQQQRPESTTVTPTGQCQCQCPLVSRTAQFQCELHADSHMRAAHSHAAMRVNTRITNSTKVRTSSDFTTGASPLCIFLRFSVSTSQSRWTRTLVGSLAFCINVTVQVDQNFGGFSGFLYQCPSPGGPELRMVLWLSVLVSQSRWTRTSVGSRRCGLHLHSFTRLSGFM